jgi:hypothetical protein
VPCFVAVIALLSPRLALFLLAVFTDAPSGALGNIWVPLIGFFILPWTTFAYVFLWWVNEGTVEGFSFFIVIIAFLVDLASWFGGHRARSERYG